MKNCDKLTNKSLESQILWYMNTGIRDFQLPKEVISAYTKSGRMMWVWKIFSVLEKLRFREKKYVFLGAKYRSLICGLPRKDLLIVGGFGELMFCIRNRIGFYPSALHKLSILRLLKTQKSTNLESYQSELLQEISCILSGVQAKILVVNNDALPLERSWIAASRKIGVSSVCIQHGLFNRRLDELIDGQFVDSMLVYDEYQKQLVSNKALNPRNVFVFGYHSDVDMPLPVTKDPDHRKVCILGQPWAQYFPDTKDSYLSLIKEIISVLEANRIDFVYKPHPSEKDGLYIEQLGCDTYYGNLYGAFEKYDAFVSLTSTALFEASLHGRISIQVFDPIFSEERFDKIGYANLVEKCDLLELPSLIGGNPMLGMTAKYCNETVANRFISAIGEIGIS